MNQPVFFRIGHARAEGGGGSREGKEKTFLPSLPPPPSVRGLVHETATGSLQTCQPSRIFRDNPGNFTSLPDFFTSRSMRCVIVVKQRLGRETSKLVNVCTHTRTTCSILPCVGRKTRKTPGCVCTRQARNKN